MRRGSSRMPTANLCARSCLRVRAPPPRIARLRSLPTRAVPTGAGMAWNIPGGSSNKDGRNPWQRRGSGGFDRFLDPLRGVFGPGGGGIARWIGVLAVLWLAFNTFVLVTEQQRGVVLRFGEFSRVLQPGPHFKWPWPIERVTKVDATQIKTISETVPVLTRDENIVRVDV